MSSLLDLPDELILKVLSYTETVDILRCGQVSKRIRTISNDNSLFQTVNLSNKYLKSDLVATILNKGCKRLKLSNSFIQGKLSLVQKSQLVKLDLSNCKEKEISYGVVEELLASCRSLKKLSLKGLPLTSKRVACICKNSKTLQVLFVDYSKHEEYWHKRIIKICREMKLLLFGDSSNLPFAKYRKNNNICLI